MSISINIAITRLATVRLFPDPASDVLSSVRLFPDPASDVLSLLQRSVLLQKQNVPSAWNECWNVSVRLRVSSFLRQLFLFKWFFTSSSVIIWPSIMSLPLNSPVWYIQPCLSCRTDAEWSLNTEASVE